jgi:voltage-gated potassium channel
MFPMLPAFLLIPLVLGGLLAVALLLRRLAGREWLRRTILETDTPAGKAFDTALLVGVLISVVAVILESDPLLRQRWSGTFQALEWVFTLLFSFEYILRLLCVDDRLAYGRSFFGLVDLLSIVPTYLDLLVSGAQVLLVVRALRLLRVFRVLKLGTYLQESELLWGALAAARRKIAVFLLGMATLVVLIGALLYVIEGPSHGFRSIPVGIYWAVVTITTVGYGDVAPVTPLGRFLASVVMLLGYSILAVPTGILTAEFGAALRPPGAPSAAVRDPAPPRFCLSCRLGGHEADAMHCKHCGAPLAAPAAEAPAAGLS